MRMRDGAQGVFPPFSLPRARAAKRVLTRTKASQPLFLLPVGRDSEEASYAIVLDSTPSPLCA